ncbi:non-ribosomal peptide synthetase/type I polyketide synthase [Clostridium estertheticum]|uniref:non-ribosomal peptide synthetase/type I polyketide synthase n=1 Tax=Clostridium estertheticum TaxID=238834 RepID=UPI001C0B8F0A|nr:non-ribosomal peptide synthetase/type I polyketide synthase [Clostridium estertheticum]MBU3186316.1 amino acid adenylation domain-containing protein [Clostridium estertheticum]
MNTDTKSKNDILKRALIEIRDLKGKLNSNSKTVEPIAVIGIGCHFPGGITDTESFWEALVEQKNMISNVEDSRWRKYSEEYKKKNPYIKKAGFLKEDISAFDHKLFRLSPKEAERTDPQQRLFLKVTWEALENAGYAPYSSQSSKTGVYAGVNSNDYGNKLCIHRKVNNEIEPGDIIGSSFSFLSGRTSYLFGFQGPSITVDTACSSSLVAVDTACKGLITGDCNMAIAGGVNLMYSPETTELFGALNILSPSCEIRTFDAKANGTVRGEGCGVLVLKRLSDAERDGDYIYAVIRGSLVNQDGPSSGLTAPYGPSQEKLLRDVLNKCDLNPRDVGYIETHGTGTELGDPIEVSALGNVFSGERKNPLYIGTVKTNIGHLEAASGVAGLIKAILAVKKGEIPGNLNFETPSPHINWSEIPIEVPKKTLMWESGKGEKRVAGVSSFGLSGTNAHVVVQQYFSQLIKEQDERFDYEKNKKWPFKFSSNTEKGLVNQLKIFSVYLNEKSIREELLPHLSYSQNVSKADLKEKIVIWANSLDGLKENLSLALDGKGNLDIKQGYKDKKVIFLFTGQGSQYPLMFQEFYNTNSTFRYWMDKIDGLYKGYTGMELLKIIFSSDNLINETQYTQPALFAVEYSLGKMWIEYGVNPTIMMGHSIGEYVAACLSGVFQLKDAVKMVTSRGQFMHELSKKGKMAAVFMEREKVEKLLNNKKRVSIAATNSPEQTIISGDEKEINEIYDSLKNQGIKIVFLNVSHGFHSLLMEPMLEKFETVTRGIKYYRPSNTIISNVTGKPIEEEIASWKYWSKHILSEVRFYESIQSIKNLDNYVFLEIGPAPVLTSFVESICEGKAEIIASNYPKIKTSEQIEKSIFELYNLGSNIQWRKYYFGLPLKKIFVPNYKFNEKHFELKDLMEEDIYIKSNHTEFNRNMNSLVVIEKCELDEDKSFSFKVEHSRDRFESIEKVTKYIRSELKRELKIEEDELINDENLLLCGLSSILTTSLASMWKKNLGVSLTTAALLQNCTVNKWAEILYKKIKASDEVIQNKILFTSNIDKRYEAFSLSKVQNAYLVGRNPEVSWGGVGCYASYEIDMEKLDSNKFERALTSAVKRHDMLRNIIFQDGTQKIMPEIQLPLTIYIKDSILDIDSHLNKIRNEISLQVLPLGRPMFDIRLTELNNGKWKVHFGIDFMIADALSISILWKDISYFYLGRTLPELKVTFKDYLDYEARRNHSKDYEIDKKYWLDKVESFPDSPELPLNISMDKKTKFVRRKKWINSKIWNSFVQVAAEHNLTPSAALLSLYSEVLSAWGAGSHFAVMLTVFNREAVHPQINEVIGDFTQLVLVEIHRENEAVGKNAVNIQHQMQNDIEYSNYSAIDFMKELNKMDSSKDHIYPVVFTSALGMDSLNENDETNIFGRNLESIASSTSQVWLDHQVFNEKGGVALSWDALDDVFFSGVVEAMFQKYVELVMRASKEKDFWEKTLVDLRTKDQSGVQEKANSTSEYTKDMLLYENIRHIAFLNGDKTALVFNGNKYSYKEIIHRAHQASQLLQQQGVKKRHKIGVQMNKSFDQIAIVLGILQIGAVYVPMTYDQPISRTIDIIKKGKISILFRDDYDEALEKEVIQLIPGQLNDLKGIWTEIQVRPSDLAYVIYTSGSTGTPKGVCIEHRAAMNTINDVNHRLGLTEKDSILGISSLSFDLSVYDIFGILSAGGTLVLPTEEERIDAKCWKRLSDEFNITLWNSVPALMEIYVDYIISLGNDEKDWSIRQIILSGDWIPLSLPNKIKAALPNAKLTSMGGATEASIWSNYYNVIDVKREWKSIPYGYPLTNQCFYILDEFNRPCPQWVEGRLFIGGKGLATGYLNEEKLTEEAFLNYKECNKRLYNTGDYGRYMDKGVIEFLGRKDTQMKINGYRIEGGEIRAAFKKCGNLGEPIILPVGREANKKKIVAYVKSNESPYSEAQWKSQLKSYLPSYFIPERIFILKDYPITSNGKVDRKLLIKMFEEKSQQGKSQEKVTDLGNNPVLKTVREILNMPELSPNDNFGDMGVSSVDIIRLANHLEAVYTDRPSVGEMIKYKFISELLEFYKDKNITLKEESKTRVKKEVKFSMTSKEKITCVNKVDLYESKTKLNSKLTLDDFKKMVSLEQKYREKNISLWTEAASLKFKAPEGTMTIEIREELKENKGNLIVYLEENKRNKELEVLAKKNNQFPLTPLQLAYVLGRSKDYELGNVSAHYYSEYECGNIDGEKFERAVNEVIKKNEMLRTIIYENGIQEVLSEIVSYKVKVNQISSHEDIEEIRNQWSKHCYELGKWPMFNIQISQFKDKISRIHFSFDCLVVDGWSTQMLFKEIFKAYYGLPINEPEITMREYINKEETWLKDKNYHKEAQEYWEQRVNKLPPAPMLPLKKDYKLIDKPNFARKKVTLSEKHTQIFKENIKKYHFTASATICTAYMKVLSHWSEEKDITVNLTLFNRLPLNKDVMKVLGDFTNITLVPYVYNGETSVAKEIENIQNLLWEAVEYRTYNGLNLLKTLSKNVPGKAVMPVVFTSLLFGEAAEDDDILKDMKEVYAISQTPQVVLDHQVYEKNGKITFVWDYVDEAFKKSVIDNMFIDFMKVINKLIVEEDWNKPVNISLLKDNEE